MTPIELKLWVNAAKSGHRIVYYTGFVARDRDSDKMPEDQRILLNLARSYGTPSNVEIVRTLDKSGVKGKGLGFLFQRRLQAGVHDYLFVKG